MALPSAGWCFPEVTTIGEGPPGGQTGCFGAVFGLSTAIPTRRVSRRARRRKRKGSMREGFGCLRVFDSERIPLAQPSFQLDIFHFQIDHGIAIEKF
jgi:hypothetical protein